VTLELKPEDTARIINADEKGSLKLILRSKVGK
jgi:Flp pilus assembly protein CpaB